MSQAIVDPEELTQFAQELNEFNDDLFARLNGLKGKFDRVSQTWRDHERDRFSQEFDQTIQVLVHFMEVASEQVPFLLRKAESAKEYLERQ